MAASKPRTTGNAHRLPFDALSAQKLEELCLWLVRREGYERAEYLGEAGSDQGRDVVAWKDGRRVVFQCKRVKSFGLATATKEIEKLRALPPAEQPAELVFVVSTAVSAELRKDIRDAWGAEETCHFWAGGELDERVKRHPEIVREFFQVESGSPAPTKKRRRSWLDWGIALSAIGLLATLAAWLWPQDKPRMLVVARDFNQKLLAGFSFSCGGAWSLPTNQAGATELELPPGHLPGQQIKLFLLGGPTLVEEWLLVNDIVNVPERGSPTEVVLILRSIFLRMAAEARDEIPAVSADRDDLDAARRALVELASQYGLTESQIWALIRQDSRFVPPADAISITLSLGLLEQVAEARDGTPAVAADLSEAVAETRDGTPAVAADRKDLGATRRALVELASRYGLTKAQLEAAIRSFAESASDPTDRGIAAYFEGDYTAAETLLNDAAAKNDKDFLETLRYLGTLQYEQAKYSSAASNFEKALALGGEDSALLNRLGLCLHKLARWREAEPLMRRALKIEEASFGRQHSKVATALNNLALLLQSSNRLAEAEPLMRRALEIDEVSLGVQHPKVAIHLSNLALLLKSTNRLAEAEQLMRRALEIDEASFGSEHPEVATDLFNLALLLQSSNRLPEAEPLVRRAAKILVDFNRRTGHRSDLLVVIVHYESLLQELGQSEDAIRSALQEIGVPPA